MPCSAGSQTPSPHTGPCTLQSLGHVKVFSPASQTLFLLHAADTAGNVIKVAKLAITIKNIIVKLFVNFLEFMLIIKITTETMVEISLQIMFHLVSSHLDLLYHNQLIPPQDY